MCWDMHSKGARICGANVEVKMYTGESWWEVRAN